MLRGNVFTDPLPSNGYTCHSIVVMYAFPVEPRGTSRSCGWQSCFVMWRSLIGISTQRPAVLTDVCRGRAGQPGFGFRHREPRGVLL
jgi:hypothetical protein